MSSTHRPDSTEGRSASDKSVVANSLSRSGKVETDLIETILDEMKNEFNRGVDIQDNLKNKNDESSKDSTDDECVTVKKESSNTDNKSDIKTEAKIDKRDSVEMKAEGDTVQKVVVPRDDLETNKAILVENDDSKYMSVLTLKSENVNRKIKDKSIDNESNSNNDTLSCDIGNVLPVPSGPLGKRSLRSKAALAKLQFEEPAGVKRSARRRSKDSPRESVLQSAIARKEKSFSSLSHSRDKNFTSRSVKIISRHSPVDRNQTSRTSKSPVKAQQLPASKSPRLAQQISGQASKEGESISTNGESSVLNHSDQPVVNKIRPLVQTSNTQAYTKTGKRRYRPYKGLRYSFTGNNVRRTKPVRKHMKDISSSGSASEVKQTPKPEESGEEIEVLLVTSHTEQLEGADPIAENHAAEFPVVDVCGSRSGSPVIAEACQTTSQKRKLQPDEDDIKDDRSKRSRDVNVPSPSPADSSQRPAKPESTAISNGAGTAALCYCQTKSQLFVSSRSQNGATAAELYCQAMDTLDDRVVGCCNAVSSHITRLSRPSCRVAFLILCDVHMQRLVRHNCCPACGVFCTQGKFVQCASGHWSHRDCQLTVDSAAVCPHCGLNSPSTDVILTMRTAKNPVFLPQQKPPKKVPSAKMSFSLGRESGAVTLREASPPILPPTLLMSHVSSPPLDKDKYSLKSLHQAAKSGNAEKLIHILGSGLNPNHVFRECSMGTALHAACAGGHLSVVHILLQAGANIDVLDRDQNSPLMLAAMANHNAIVKYLVKAGANVMLKGCDGMTALHLAAKAGNVESCHYLLTVTNVARVYINSVDDGGWTPLVWAAEHCHVDVARYLLQNRADPLIRDTEQNIALHWSAFSGSVDISEMLLNYGCEVNSTNVHGDTPLHIGARQNMYSCVLLLLARGARVDIANRAGDSPLECCIPENSDCYVAINLNIQLKAVVGNTQQRTQRILTNDISRGQEQNPIQCVNVEDDEGEPTDFVYVSENCFTSNISVDRAITSLQSCKCTDVCSTMNCHCGNISLRCWYDDHGRLLPDFNYTDPPMLFECNQACTCNRILCQNRVVQHGLTSRFQLFRTKDKGWGVRTLRAISKGTYVCEYIGEIISDCEADHREDDSYLFDLDNRDGETYCIDARHYGNVARFINHMCVPNLLPVRVFIEHQDLHFPRIAFFANRDIEADEELGWVKTSRGSYI